MNRIQVVEADGFGSQPLYRLVWIVLWLLLGTTLLAASVPENSYGSSLTYAVPQITISLRHANVIPGATQTIDIQIDELAGRRTSVILVVTYPSDKIERTLHNVESGKGSITWPIPPDAGSGEASFRLIADGCTCGEYDRIPRPKPVDGELTGIFTIVAD